MLALTYEANTTCHKDLAARHSTNYVHDACAVEPCFTLTAIPGMPPRSS